MLFLRVAQFQALTRNERTFVQEKSHLLQLQGRNNYDTWQDQTRTFLLIADHTSFETVETERFLSDHGSKIASFIIRQETFPSFFYPDPLSDIFHSFRRCAEFVCGIQGIIVRLRQFRYFVEFPIDFHTECRRNESCLLPFGREQSVR